MLSFQIMCHTPFPKEKHCTNIMKSPHPYTKEIDLIIDKPVLFYGD